MTEAPGATRRDLLAAVLMGGGLVLAYGTLALQGILFLLPKRLRPKTRLIFAGRVDQFDTGAVRTVYDLDGSAILVKRGETGSARSVPISVAGSTGRPRPCARCTPSATTNEEAGSRDQSQNRYIGCQCTR